MYDSRVQAGKFLRLFSIYAHGREIARKTFFNAEIQLLTFIPFQTALRRV